MSLYEASAHIFYGVRIQRMGRDADTNLPLNPDDCDSAKSALSALGKWREPPDWYAAFVEYRKANPSIHYLPDLRRVDPSHAILRLFDEAQAAIRAQTFGCELETMGASESDDRVLYAVVKDSHARVGFEDDHGGFGEEVIADAFLVTQEGWHDALTKFCALIGVPPELVRPRWTLTLRG